MTADYIEKSAEQRNLKLNNDKSWIKCKEISYIGHIIGKDRQGGAAKVPWYGKRTLPNSCQITPR